MNDLDTAEYRKLALVAAGVDLSAIPPILDTATWRHFMLAALQNVKVNSLDDIGGVDIQNPTDGQSLVYQSGSWTNSTPSSPVSVLQRYTTDTILNTVPSFGGQSASLQGGKTYKVLYSFGFFGTGTVTAIVALRQCVVLGGTSASLVPNQSPLTFVAGNDGTQWTIANSTNMGTISFSAIVEAQNNNAEAGFLAAVSGGAASIKSGSFIFAEEVSL